MGRDELKESNYIYIFMKSGLRSTPFLPTILLTFVAASIPVFPLPTSTLIFTATNSCPKKSDTTLEWRGWG